MQSLQPDPAARYKNVMDALRRIVATEGVWRPLRGLNATAIGAGPAHALYFASYEKLKKTLSDTIHPGANSHLANGTIKLTLFVHSFCFESDTPTRCSNSNSKAKHASFKLWVALGYLWVKTH